jgi:hypothetical protein
MIPLAAVAVLAVAGVALAFFTSSGTGSGTASVGTDAGVTIDPVTIAGTLYPNGPAATVDFTINNTSTDTSVHVGKVVADTSAGTHGITGLPAGCSASDFTFDDVTVGNDIAAGDSIPGSGSLSMADSGVNQDACKNAHPVLHLKIDNT